MPLPSSFDGCPREHSFVVLPSEAQSASVSSPAATVKHAKHAKRPPVCGSALDHVMLQVFYAPVTLIRYCIIVTSLHIHFVETSKPKLQMRGQTRIIWCISHFWATSSSHLTLVMFNGWVLPFLDSVRPRGCCVQNSPFPSVVRAIASSRIHIWVPITDSRLRRLANLPILRFIVIGLPSLILCPLKHGTTR